MNVQDRDHKIDKIIWEEEAKHPLPKKPTWRQVVKDDWNATVDSLSGNQKFLCWVIFFLVALAATIGIAQS
ncbi:MAG TPA: hypothetical protein VIJ88_01245 [Candidatus Paceibacterota bacterium]